MIPAIDLGAFVSGSATERQTIAAEVDATCRTIGFLMVENHGVSDHVGELAWQSARQFFELSLEDKLNTRSADPGCPRGYFSIDEETLARTRGQPSAPDPKESFSCGPPSRPFGHRSTPELEFFYGQNLWPDALPHFKASWLSYYAEMEKLGTVIMQLLAEALGVDTHFFEAYHTHHLGALRGINYPSLPGHSATSRAGEHSDYGSVTILMADPDVGGLEIQTPECSWIGVPHMPGTFIVNIGDLMAHWTNNRWVSTLHRVVAPGGTPVPRRQSIAYFMNPNYDAEITVLPTCSSGTENEPPIVAGEYLLKKFRSAFQ